MNINDSFRVKLNSINYKRTLSLFYKDFAAAIGHSGFNYLQHQYLSSLDQQNSQLKDIFYESAWKLGKWDLVEPCDDEKNFSYHQYAALNDIYHNNYDGARNNVKVARRCLIPLLARMDLESTKNFYHIQTKLQCLQVSF